MGEPVHGVLTAGAPYGGAVEVQQLLGGRPSRMHGVQRRPSQEGHEHALAVHSMQNLSHGKTTRQL